MFLQNISKHLYFHLIFALCLVACGADIEPTAVEVTRPTETVPTPTQTSTPNPTPTNTAQPAPTDSPSPTATIEPIPPTATPTEEPTPIPQSRFQADNSFPDFPILALWSMDGQAWASSPNATYRFQNGAWEQAFAGSASSPFSNTDNEGRHWLVYEGYNLSFYRDDVGLVRYPELVLTEQSHKFYADEMVTDGLGQVWWANGRQGLFRYIPQTDQWQKFGYADIGFPAPPEDTNLYNYADEPFYTNVALDSLGNVWVTACPFVQSTYDVPLPPRMWSGYGVRWFNGEQWQGVDAEHCYTDIEVDSTGQVWLGGAENVLTVYDPTQQTWRTIPLPTFSAFEGTRQFANDLTIAPDGSIWVDVERHGGASQVASGIYRLAPDETWEIVLPIVDKGEYLDVGGSFQFSGDNTVWFSLFSAITPTNDQLFGIWQYIDGEFVNPNGEIAMQACYYTVAEDRLWVSPCEADALIYIELDS